MSMDSSGKIIFAKHSEILQANLKNLGDTECKDGERLPVAVKEMGSCEIYPQTLSHNPNGRWGIYIIHIWVQSTTLLIASALIASATLEHVFICNGKPIWYLIIDFIPR